MTVKSQGINFHYVLFNFHFNCLQIVNPPKDLKKPRGKKCFFVKFFGTEDQYVPACFHLVKIPCHIIWIFQGRNIY